MNIQEMKTSFIAGLIESLRVLISASAPSGLTITKTSATLKMAAFLAPFAFIDGLQFWVADNVLYLNLVIGAVFLDWILGTIKHLFWLRDFRWLENLKGVLVKLILVLAIGSVFEGLKLLTKEIDFVTKYFIIMLRVSVFLYPAMSVIRSSRVISNGQFPPQGLYNKIEQWASEIGKEKEKQ